MQDLKTKKLNRPKLELHKLLTTQGAWRSSPVCTFKHRNLYNNKDYTFEGYVLAEVVTYNFKQYKILTYDGKQWHKHKVLDEVKIIKPGSNNE